MQGFSLTFPTLKSADMTPADQVLVSLNQATAAIVCAYLDHHSRLVEVGKLDAPNTQNPKNNSITDQDKLVTLIDKVQAALKEGLRNALRNAV